MYSINGDDANDQAAPGTTRLARLAQAKVSASQKTRALQSAAKSRQYLAKANLVHWGGFEYVTWARASGTMNRGSSVKRRGKESRILWLNESSHRSRLHQHSRHNLMVMRKGLIAHAVHSI